MIEKLKQAAVQVVSGLKPSPWQSKDLTKVAMQTFEGFEEQLWMRAVEREIPDAHEKVELLFVSDKIEFYSALRDAEVCSTMELSSSLLGLANRVKWINTLVAGIDVEELPEPPMGVSITTSRGIAARSIAEHALMLLLSLRKNLHVAHRHQQEGKWTQEEFLGKEDDLRGLSVAVFGLGSAGSEVAKLCKSMGMRVIGVRRSALNQEVLCDEVCALADFRSILPVADAVVLTLPLTRGTRDLFTEREMRLMKPSAILINVARGGLVREDHLASALRAGTIGRAGLDVLTEEPPAGNSPLKDCPNLMITPHVAGNIHKFRNQIASRFAKNLSAFLNGRPLEGLLPRDYWSDPTGKAQRA